MINKLYYNDLKKALKASFKNGIAIYINQHTNSNILLKAGELIYIEPNTFT